VTSALGSWVDQIDQMDLIDGRGHADFRKHRSYGKYGRERSDEVRPVGRVRHGLLKSGRGNFRLEI